MKIMKLAGLLVIVGAVALSGCARIQLYKDENCKGPQVGVKFYYSKPYLLVARTNSKDNPVQVSVIYLPDQSQPIYARLKSGYGSAEHSLAFQNGILTNIGQKTDTKIPETITAVAGMATVAKGLIPQAADYPKISAALKSKAEGLSDQSKKAKKTKELTKDELQALEFAAGQVKDAGDLLENPRNAESNVPTVISCLNSAIKSLKLIKEGTTPIRETIKKYSSELEDIVKELSPEPKLLDFELYEIDTSSAGITNLKRVR